MSANLTSSETRQLDRRPDPNETITPDNCSDPKALARLLTRLLRDVQSLKSRWFPRRLDFEDIPVGHDGTTLYHFAHRLGGRVRWWVVGFSGSTATSILIEDTSTDENILVLRSFVSGTVTVRVEAAG